MRNHLIHSSALALFASLSFILPTLAADLPAPLQGTSIEQRTQDDPRVRKFITPERIVWRSEDKGCSVTNAEALLGGNPGQASLDARNACELRNTTGRAGLLLDFGVELHGGVRIMTTINTKDNKPVRLRVRFGESVSEAMSELGGEQNAGNDHAVRDQTILVPWLGSIEIGQSGFRFVRIDLADPDSFVQLKNVQAVFLYRDLEYKGSFHSSDERLNRIWNTGAYTVHLNMQDYLWDGVKRDRLVWIGDMHPETMTILSVFGANPIVPKSLDFIRDETPLPNWMNGISSYSMWWVLIHHTWYEYTGDRDYLMEQKPYMTGLLKLLSKQVGPDNRETMPPGRFLDWPSSENQPAIHAGLHSLLIMTLRAGAEMCEVFGDDALKQECKNAAARLLKHTPDPNHSKQAAALMALAELKDAAALNREVMAPGGAHGMSTFYGYYVLRARAKADDIQGCLDCIRDYWGAMLDLGATTFWEDFNLDWTENAAPIDEVVPEGKKDIHGDFGAYCYIGFRHSLCHGWASGPTAWLSENVLGVHVVEPGCKMVKIEPRLGDLDWVEGTFPTPYGVIRLKHVKQADGNIHSEIDAPDEVTVVR
ncbi:MAG: Bacterial alpha-L-rhamnosidase [bacterium]|nr:Bacterial alpha-L-rhamnosidase [bacterium]